MVNHADFKLWRPLVYVIPVADVSGRIETVPMDKCAGFSEEYIIKDLKRSEFDIIEP